MQKKTKQIIYAVVFGAMIPAILAEIALWKFSSKSVLPIEISETTILATEQTEQEEVKSFYIPVIFENGSVMDMELEAYITGVVLAEMPADFEREALKAQAVVARTYALKGYYGKEKHPNRAICTNPSCCQAYCAPEDYKGTSTSYEKVKNAVLQTSLEVLTYQSELIDATYFSCSGGKTEDAKAVWGADVPYLRSVESPGEETAAHYMDTIYFTLQEFAECMQINVQNLRGNWVGEVTYTNGGGVENITICGNQYTGTQMRKLLGLRSTAFAVTAVGNTVTVTTKGFGHRVGMSQYGADAMAVSGKNYQEILAYYYQGTVIEKIAI